MSEHDTSTDIFKQQYISALTDIGEFRTAYDAALAEDWVPYQRASGLLVPRYLEGLNSEVGTRTSNTVKAIEDVANHWMRACRPLDGKDEFASVRAISEARTFAQAERLYKAHDSCIGLPFLAFHDRLFRTAYGKAYHGSAFEEARSMVTDYAEDPIVIDVMQRGIDHAVFRYITGGRPLDASRNASIHASSDTTRRTLLAAFDFKVLRWALKKKGTSYTESANIVSEYASTPTAREAMLGHLALKAENPRMRSRYKIGYRSRTEHLRDDIRAKNQARRDEAQRTREEQWKREREQRDREWKAREERWRRESEERSRQYENSNRRFREQYNAGDVHSDYTACARLGGALRLLDFKVARTLRTYPEPELQRVIAEVDSLRSSRPAMTARDVYLHFRGKAEVLDSSVQETETVKILGLFMDGDLSKASTLPF